jgi:hypothetical protein
LTKLTNFIGILNSFIISISLALFMVSYACFNQFFTVDLCLPYIHMFSPESFPDKIFGL